MVWRIAYFFRWFLTRTSWFIDPVLGNDKYRGSKSKPLRTYKEFYRRVDGCIKVNTTLIFLSDVPFIDGGISMGARIPNHLFVAPRVILMIQGLKQK